MSIDILTLAFVLGITNVVQVIVFSLQAATNRTCRGVGWWLLWSALAATGFVFILLRDIPSFHLIATIGQNSLITLAVIFLYVGIMRFLDKQVNRWIVLAAFAVFFGALVYFTYINNDFVVRTVIICLVWAAISFLTAQGLIASKIRSVNASANFLAAVFIAHGCYDLFRAVMVLAGVNSHDMFSPSLFNASVYLDGIIVSILWTSGLIIMVNQRSNAEMAEAKEHFELIFNTSPYASLIARLTDGLIVNINDGFTALTGFTRDETIGKSSISAKIWKNPQDRKKIIEELGKKGFCDNVEAAFKLKDGSQAIGALSAKVITLHGIPHMISVTRDITERKRAEEALRESEKKYRLLIDNANESIIVAQDGLLKFVNSMTLSLLGGYSEQELTDRPFPEFIHPDDRNMVVENHRRRITNEAAKPRYAFRVVARDGIVKWVEINAALIEWQGKPATLNLLTDITSRKHAEEALKRKYVEIERINNVTVGREVRMIELKREVNALYKAAGQPEKYRIAGRKEELTMNCTGGIADGKQD